jgi:osmotically-inducible protein OsmY
MFFRSLAALAVVGSLAVPAVAYAQTTPPRTPPQNPPAAKAAPAQVPTDESLKDRIAFRLETSPNIRKYDLRVKVENKVATLTGDVATAAQKAEAERLAKIDGLARVINDIKVDPDEDKSVTSRIESGLTKTGEAITDAWITTKVKWFFLGEDALKGSDINVDTKNNVVTLKGTVKSEAGRQRAIELAKFTDGVTRVQDQLTIK